MANKTTRITLKQFQKLFKKDFPNYFRFAAANTLTSAAYKGMQHSEKWLSDNWIQRNKFLLGGGPGKGAIKYNRAKPSHDISTIWSSWGSPKSHGSKNFEFMLGQEEGFKTKGTTPANKARISKNYKKRIPSKNKRRTNNIEKLRGAALGKRFAIISLRRLFKRRFALPGSNQFFFMKQNQFSNFGGGLYQFAKNRKPNKLSQSGAKLQFPNIKKMFAAPTGAERIRKGTSWMKKSSLLIKQSDLEKIFEKAADQAFTGQLKLWKN